MDLWVPLVTEINEKGELVLSGLPVGNLIQGYAITSQNGELKTTIKVELWTSTADIPGKSLEIRTTPNDRVILAFRNLEYIIRDVTDGTYIFSADQKSEVGFPNGLEVAINVLEALAVESKT